MKIINLDEVKVTDEVRYVEKSQLLGNIGDQPSQPKEIVHIYLNSKVEMQTIKGIGGAFSEQGGKALQSLNDDKIDEISQKLFKDRFNFFRLPVGADDFALDAYSLNDNEDDFAMEKFSLERDEKYLIPFMELAKKYCEDMEIHASPWAPPFWFKDSKQMCGAGRIIDEDKYYEAYALYFAKLVEEYAKKGFKISRINIQNEPDATPVYPGCDMEPEQMCKFIKNFMHPYFKKNNIDTEIFAGTFRSLTGSSGLDLLSADEDIKDYIDGLGFQYSSMQQIYDINAKYPNLKLMHTESNCFRGENTWDQAIVLYINIVNYLSAGCDSYTYWNMILNSVSTSTWGWKQNSMIAIDEDSKEVTYNPDFYVMDLASNCLTKGSKRIVYSCMEKHGVAVKNDDGSINFMVSNFSKKEQKCKLFVDGEETEIILNPMSIHSYKVIK